MPRFISDDEAAKLNPVPMGKKHIVRAMLEKSEVGKNLHVTREEFKWKKHSPARIANDIKRKTGKEFSVEKTKNGNGWLVKRLK